MHIVFASLALKIGDQRWLVYQKVVAHHVLCGILCEFLAELIFSDVPTMYVTPSDYWPKDETEKQMIVSAFRVKLGYVT